MKTMSANLEGKIAVVTGSTRGIGRAIADALAGLGAEVIITARGGEDVARVVNEMANMKYKARGIRCDTRSYEDAKALMTFAAEGSGGFDILVNNAGIGVFGHISEVTPDDWDQVIDTNLTGVFYCCHAALPYLRKRGGGYILNISSLAGKNAFKGGTLYNASKFGLEGLSEALMLDLRYENIKVSYIMPGSVATEFSGRRPSEKDTWKLTSEDVARVVTDLLTHDHRALASRVELRPFQPKKS
jgi:NAD(P)-dependent dehydrogenase (short-subunit alcohol dehydrogenase family)